MRRREVYATSGPRIAVRTYGGLNLQEPVIESAVFPADIQLQAVPMGGEIIGAARGIVLVSSWKHRRTPKCVPRPYSDHQGLDRRVGSNARACVRRCREWGGAMAGGWFCHAGRFDR